MPRSFHILRSSSCYRPSEYASLKLNYCTNKQVILYIMNCSGTVTFAALQQLQNFAGVSRIWDDTMTVKLLNYLFKDHLFNTISVEAGAVKYNSITVNL